MSTKNSCTGGKKTTTRRKGGMMGTAREIREFGQLPQAEQINAIYQKIIDCPALNKNNMFTPADEEGDKLFNIFKIVEAYTKTLPAPYTSPPIPPRSAPPRPAPSSRPAQYEGRRVPEPVIGEKGKRYALSVPLKPPEGFYVHQTPSDWMDDGSLIILELPEGKLAKPFPEQGYYDPRTVIHHRGGRKQSINKNKK